MSDDSGSQRARYEFKRKLEELENVRGRGTELISLYIPPDKQISDVTAQLRDELGQAQNIKSKSTRKNVSAALESILARMKHFGHNPPPNGVIFFVGHKAVGGDQTRMVQHVLEPPSPIDLYTYRCDSTFFLEPLEGLLKEQNNYGLLVVDRSEATIGMLRGSRVEVISNFQSQVPGKHTKGGQSQRRFERLTEEAAHNFFKKVGDVASDVFLNQDSLKGVLVGGPGSTKDYFVDQAYMHHEIQNKVVETFDTGYTDEYGLRDLVHNAQETLRQMGLMEEKDLMQRFLREVAKEDGGLASYGEDHVRHMLTIGAVDTLLLSEKLRKYRVEVACTGCDYEAVETTKDVDAFEDALESCPQCGTALQLEGEEDIMEELSKKADDMGSSVEIISAGSDEGELLYNAFGGTAAILRFKVKQ